LRDLDDPFQGPNKSKGDARQTIGIDGYSSNPNENERPGLPSRHGLKTDQDEALAAVENGKILPLKGALKQVTEIVSGKVIDVKMSQTSDGGVYHVKVRTPDGEIRNIDIDAKTGKRMESLRN